MFEEKVSDEKLYAHGERLLAEGRGITVRYFFVDPPYQECGCGINQKYIYAAQEFADISPAIKFIFLDGKGNEYVLRETRQF